MEIFGINLWPARSVEDDEFPERRRWRWFLLIATLVIAGASFALWPSLRGAYRHFRAERLADQGRALIASGDFASARTHLTHALRFEGGRADLHEALADSLRGEGSPQQATVLAHAATLAPDRADLAVRAAQSCVENEHTDVLARLAPKMLESHPKNAALQYWIGLALLREGQTAAAAAALETAARLAPADERLHLDIALREAAASTPEIAARGIARLESLRNRPGFPHSEEATRALASALPPADATAALKLWEEHLARNKPSWPARLSHLDALARANPAALPARFEVLWAQAANPSEKADLLGRIASWNGPAAAADAIQKLSTAERLASPILLLHLDLLAKAGQWKELLTVVDAATKSRAPYSVDDQIALWRGLAEARRALGDISGSQGAIRAVENLAGSSPTRALDAAEWLAARNFDFEAVGLFRTAARPNSPVRCRSLQGLRALHHRQGNLQEELKAAEQLLQLDGENPYVKNALASVMLELGWDRTRALRLSREAWNHRRESFEFANTFARALALDGQAHESVAMFERMPPEILAKDAIRLNYAEALMAAGRSSDALLQFRQIRQDGLEKILQIRRERLEIELRAR